MTKRPRAGRRALARDAEKLVERKRKLAALEPGGSPDRAIEVASASVVESHARAMPCALCEGTVRVDEHAVEDHRGLRLRVAHVVCSRCGSERPVYYRIMQAN